MKRTFLFFLIIIAALIFVSCKNEAGGEKLTPTETIAETITFAPTNTQTPTNTPTISQPPHLLPT